jgi:hypothetical protein
MAIRRRLERLEARTPPPAPVRPGGVTLDEMRALEEHIRRQEAGDEAGPAPEADHFLEEPELDHEIVAVEREIERLELLGAGRGRQALGITPAR